MCIAKKKKYWKEKVWHWLSLVYHRISITHNRWNPQGGIIVGLRLLTTHCIHFYLLFRFMYILKAKHFLYSILIDNINSQSGCRTQKQKGQSRYSEGTLYLSLLNDGSWGLLLRLLGRFQSGASGRYRKGAPMMRFTDEIRRNMQKAGEMNEMRSWEEEMCFQRDS